MPSMYTSGSYQELEHRLVDLRTTHQQLHWHVAERYWRGQRRLITASLRKTRNGLAFTLPPRTERISASPFPVGKSAQVYVYQWSETVNPAYVTEGVKVLTGTMYGGNVERIKLPVLVLRQKLGLSVEAA